MDITIYEPLCECKFCTDWFWILKNFNKYFDIVYHNLHIFMHFNMHIITGCYSAIDLTETKVAPCKFSQQISYKYLLPYFTLVTLHSWRLWTLSSKQIVGCNCSYAPKICCVLIIVSDLSTVYCLYNSTNWDTFLKFIINYCF